jgi:hypothetical protein
MHSEGDSVDRMVQLRFQPLWLYVDEVREFCGFFARATFRDEEIGQRVGIVVHELVENAIRYGDEKDLELRLERSDGRVVISVANTTSEERAHGLQAYLGTLRELPPDEAYARALRNAASLPETQSGLGLARIRCEGQFDLELDVTPGRVRVTATGAA